jgi:tetratricopeptide (TPR) repeat protein
VAQSSDDLATGVTLFERGQFAAAQQFFEAFVSQYPTDPAGAYYLGRIAFEGERYEQAATWFEKAVQLGGGNSDSHLWLGRTYGHQAQAAKSEAFFLARKVKTHLEKAVELNPDNIEARFDLLEYYLQAFAFVAGGHTKAKEQAEEIAKRNAAAGRKAWQRCEQEDAQRPGEEVTPPQNEPAGTDQ